MDLGENYMADKKPLDTKFPQDPENEDLKGPSGEDKPGTEREKGLMDKVEALEGDLKKNEERIRDLEDGLLRGRAELENLRKRLNKEMEEALKYATEPFLKELLPSIDNLERALEAARNSQNIEALVEGLTLTLSELRRILTKHGVKEIESLGQYFDPRVHEALECLEADQVPSGYVCKEYQKGYLLHDRLIRPAKVAVSVNQSSKEPQ
jgi:molecular chaperone GrpE